MKVPLVIKNRFTVIDDCGKLHREFVKNFRNPKCGYICKFLSQKVGSDYVVEDEDIFRVFLKK